MKEIKFRAWDMHDDENWGMVYPEKNNHNVWMIAFCGDGTPFFILVADERFKYPRPIAREIIAMQYTGLKDKNGKEIYEGDIIRHAKNISFRVYWHRDGSWNLEEIGIKSTDLLWKYAEVSEIIGDIYENPELLKKK